MAKNKTNETQNSVSEYVAAIVDEKRRADVEQLIDLLQKSTGIEPKMWGTSIVGFGNYDYTYNSGHSGSAPLVALSSRANAITLYLAPNFDNKEALLSKFGKHKTGKGCIYIQKIEDIDTQVLLEMAHNSIKFLRETYLS